MIKMGSCPVCEGEAYLKEGANGSIKMSSYHYNNCPMILDSPSLGILQHDLEIFVLKIEKQALKSKSLSCGIGE